MDHPRRGHPGPGPSRRGPIRGFAHGGWHLRFFDDASRAWVVRGYEEAGGFLFGRRTFESLAGYWPDAGEEEQVIARPLNTKPKYVVSTTLTEPLAWEHSHLLRGDVAEAVAELKAEDGGDLHIVGSSALLATLLQDDVVDRFRLMIDPLVVGGGKRLFHEDGTARPLRLVESEPTSTGAILATYERVRD